MNKFRKPETETQDIKDLVVRLLGYTPKFINADTGRFSGTILIHDASSRTRNIWNIMADLDHGLQSILESDVLELPCSFEYDGMQEDEDENAVFQIKFIFD